MSEGLKSWHIEAAVWERGPRAPTDRAVLAQLAKYSDPEGVTFVGQKTIAERSGYSPVSVKRAIAQLEREGWFTVEERAALIQTRNGDLQRRGNRYRLNLVKLGIRAQGSGIRRVEGVSPAPATPRDEGEGPARSDVEGERPVEKKHIGWSRDEGNGPAKAVQTDSLRSHLSGAEVSNESRRGLILGPPLNKKNKQENRTQRQLPPRPPSSDVQTEEKSSGQSPEQHGQPTQPQRLAGQYGGSMRLLAFPTRQSTELKRQLHESVRQTLDGEEAALWDEVTEVLKFCGVSPESSGRKQRQAVSQALQLAMKDVRWTAGAEPGLTIAQAGEYARGRWAEYRQMGPYLLAPSGVTRFFASGEWRNPSLWRFSLAGQERLRRGGL